MLIAVLDDVGRGHRADAVDRLEVGLVGGAEADRPVGGRLAGGGGAGGHPLRDDDLLAVGEAAPRG